MFHFLTCSIIIQKCLASLKIHISHIGQPPYLRPVHRPPFSHKFPIRPYCLPRPVFLLRFCMLLNLLPAPRQFLKSLIRQVHLLGDRRHRDRSQRGAARRGPLGDHGDRRFGQPGRRHRPGRSGHCGQRHHRAQHDFQRRFCPCAEHGRHGDAAR